MCDRFHSSLFFIVYKDLKRCQHQSDLLIWVYLLHFFILHGCGDTNIYIYIDARDSSIQISMFMLCRISGVGFLSFYFFVWIFALTCNYDEIFIDRMEILLRRLNKLFTLVCCVFKKKKKTKSFRSLCDTYTNM